MSFGRYEPLFRIASGGMAEVFAARIRGEAGFQKLVAVKRMHPHMASDQSFVDMFLNEARLAAHISSPNVVQTLDLGRGSDGSLYIVMELVVGLSLAALVELRRSPLPVPIVLALMSQAAQGLDDAHEATTPAGDELGLVHRDISPHNILVGLDGRARVTDFGIARAIHAPRSETNVKELKGKFAYMSPEQTRLKPLDHRSDVFSLGVVTWELLVGDKLFADLDAGLTIKNVRRRKIEPPHARIPSVPPEVSEIVNRALQRLPTKRYQSAGVLADALRRAGDAMGGLPSRKRVAQFVRETGGEELERLQRLIRLGTEGAAEAAFEKVRPGSTQVLGTADASGVARVVEGTDAGPDVRAPKPDTVVLPEDDEASFEDEPPPEERPDPEPTRNQRRPSKPPGPSQKPTRNLRALRYERMKTDGPPTVDLHREPDLTTPALQDLPVELEAIPVDPAAPPLVPEVELAPRSVGRWIAGGVVAGVLIVAIAGALIWVAQDQPDTVPMPPTPDTPAQPTETADPTEASPEAARLPEPAEPSEPVERTTPTERGPGEAQAVGTPDEENLPAEEASPEGATGATPGSRAGRPGRRRHRRGRTRTPAPDDPPSGNTPLILDVNAFDQRTPSR